LLSFGAVALVREFVAEGCDVVQRIAFLPVAARRGDVSQGPPVSMAVEYLLFNGRLP
jgi:hypothetical protein